MRNQWNSAMCLVRLAEILPGLALGDLGEGAFPEASLHLGAFHTFLWLC